MEGKGGVGFKLFVKEEVYAGFVYGDDLGAVEEAASDDVEDLAGFGAEDADEMGGLVASEGGGGVGPGVGDPAAAGHALVCANFRSHRDWCLKGVGRVGGLLRWGGQGDSLVAP